MGGSNGYSLMELASEVLKLVLSALFGGCVVFVIERHWNQRATRMNLRPFAFRLAVLAIRARHEVLNQFVKVDEGPWIPDALVRQKYLFDDLENLISGVRPATGELYVLLWAARDALDSNMAVLSSWQYRHDVVPSVEHIGPDAPSHLDLFAAAYFLTRAVETIPDKAVRRDSQRVAERIIELRREATQHVQPTIKHLQSVDDSDRSDWVRTGRS